jgi:hypothetical protein
MLEQYEIGPKGCLYEVRVVALTIWKALRRQAQRERLNRSFQWSLQAEATACVQHLRSRRQETIDSLPCFASSVASPSPYSHLSTSMPCEKSHSSSFGTHGGGGDLVVATMWIYPTIGRFLLL